MTSSSSSSTNTSNKPPTRKSALRCGNEPFNDGIKHSSTDNNSTSTKKQKISGYWTSRKSYYAFVPTEEHSAECSYLLIIKIKKCISLVKQLIQVSINNYSSSINSSSELLLATTHLIKNNIFPFSFISILNSNFVKKLIATAQDKCKKTAKIIEIPSIEDIFSRLIIAISEAIDHVKTSTKLEGELEQKNWSKPSIEKSFIETASSIFKDNIIIEDDDDDQYSTEIKSIIISSAGPLKDSRATKAQNSLILESLNKIASYIKEALFHICLHSITSGIHVPLSVAEITNIMEKSLEIDISPIRSILGTKIWLYLTFCTIASIFLNDSTIEENENINYFVAPLKSHFPIISEKYFTNKQNKIRIINKMVGQLLLYERSDLIEKHTTKAHCGYTYTECDYMSSIKTILLNFIESFVSLKKLLNVLSKNISKFRLDIKHCCPYKSIEEEFNFAFENLYFREILLIAIDECKSIETIKSIPINPTSQPAKEICNIQIPKRSSIRRAKRKRSSLIKQATENTSASTYCFKNKSNPLNIPKEEIVLPKEGFLKINVAKASDLSMLLCSPKIEKLASSIERIFLLSLEILMLSESEHENLSPQKLVEKALSVAMLAICEEDNENEHTKKCNQSSLKSLLKTKYALGTLSFIRAVKMTLINLSYGTTPLQKQIHELSIDLIRIKNLLVDLFKELRAMIISYAEANIEDDPKSPMGAIKITIFFMNLATELRLHPTNILRHDVILQDLINLSLQESYED